MRSPRSACLFVVVAMALAACTSGGSAQPSPSPSSTRGADPTTGPSASPPPLVDPAFDVRVRDARGAGPDGDLPPADIAPAADAVAEVLATMFTIGFVDRDAW